MNSINLIYKPISFEPPPLEVEISDISKVFKQVRQAIKPLFPAVQLRYENVNGYEAHAFNRRIGRFKSDWLPFLIDGYQTQESDYPNDDEIYSQGLIQATEIATEQEWLNTIVDEIAKKRLYLMVGMTYTPPQEGESSRRMALGGVPAHLWPCRFLLFEFIVTNAPTCLFVKHRPHILL